MMSSNYFATESGQILYQADRYLSAARVLRLSETWKRDPNLIQTPTLFLVAHGAELLLKFRLLEQGDSQAAVAKKFGHNLAKLWAADANAEVRQLVLDCAETAWQMARGSGQYPDDDFTDDPRCAYKGPPETFYAPWPRNEFRPQVYLPVDHKGTETRFPD
jgi:hypothetical protein